MNKFLKDEEFKKQKALKHYIQNVSQKNQKDRFKNFTTRKEITWQEIEKWVEILSEHIRGGNYCGIYGIPKGGLILGILLAYRTKLPLLMAPKQGCLVVDDDMTSGLTILPFFNRFDTAVMFVNPDCPIKPTYFYEKYSESEFRYFAWNKGMEE